ncbi:MAG: hypothetical protein MZV63_12160 [Marinilabiliales bacterium]|nr:hypothetical protein [Marinilabiliales bacterium]
MSTAARGARRYEWATFEGIWNREFTLFKRYWLSTTSSSSCAAGHLPARLRSRRRDPRHTGRRHLVRRVRGNGFGCHRRALRLRVPRHVQHLRAPRLPTDV